MSRLGVEGVHEESVVFERVRDVLQVSSLSRPSVRWFGGEVDGMEVKEVLELVLLVLAMSYCLKKVVRVLVREA